MGEVQQASNAVSFSVGDSSKVLTFCRLRLLKVKLTLFSSGDVTQYYSCVATLIVNVAEN